jgi:hypothetical protein
MSKLTWMYNGKIFTGMNLLTALEVIVGIFTIIAEIYGAMQFIDKRIEKKLQDDSFVRKVAASLRPAVVFDEHGSIIIDQGGMEIIDSIEIKHSEGSNLPSKIIVNPKRHLAHPPFIFSLENEMIDFKSFRGDRFIWNYELNYIVFNDDYDGKRRFRMEIIP